MRYTGYHRFMQVLHGEMRTTWPVCIGSEVDVTRMDALRNAWTAAQGNEKAPSYTAMIVKGIALGIAQLRGQYPQLSAMIHRRFGRRRIHVFDRISAGVAVAGEWNGQDVVTMGVIADPERKSLGEMTEELGRFGAEAASLQRPPYIFRAPGPIQWIMARLGAGSPSLRLQHRGTFALTTVGKFGVDYQLTVPQGACVQFGVGCVREIPMVRDGQVRVARSFCLSLSYDHRLINGKPAAILLERVRAILEQAAFDDADAANAA